MFTYLFWFFFHFSFETKMISYNFSDSFGIPSARMHLGQPPQKKYLDLDMEVQFNWLNIKNYDPEKSVSHKKHDKKLIRVENQSAHGVRIEESLYFPNENQLFEHFNFYFVSDSFAFTGGCLSLTYNHHNKNFSIVHQLYDSNLIDRLSFSVISSDKANGILTFGGIPEIGIRSNKYNGTCKVNENRDTWGCDLKKVSIGKYTYNNKYPMHFQSGESAVRIPKDFFLFLKNEVFKEYLETNKCSLIKYILDDVIRCEDRVYDELPDFYFDFGEYSVTLDKKYLFHQMFKQMQLGMYIQKEGETDWIFGMPFFKSHHVLFDYEKNTITFYSNSTIIHWGDIKYYQKILFWYCIGMLICTIIVLIGVKVIKDIKI